MLIPNVSHCRAPVRCGNTSRDAGTVCWWSQGMRRSLSLPEGTSAYPPQWSTQRHSMRVTVDSTR
jgi:hypothetical protein